MPLMQFFTRGLRPARPHPPQLQDHFVGQQRHGPASPNVGDSPLVGRSQSRHRRYVVKEAKGHKREGNDITAHHPLLVDLDLPLPNRVERHPRCRDPGQDQALQCKAPWPPVRRRDRQSKRSRSNRTQSQSDIHAPSRGAVEGIADAARAKTETARSAKPPCRR